jgi:flagellar biosynthesis/type III secretory pathway chaperone
MNQDKGLIAILGAQIRCAEAMIEALAREHQALADNDAALLQTASTDKAQLVEALETLESQRRNLAETIATTLNAEAGDDTHAAVEWQRLHGLIGECKERNERNGTLLKARTQNVRIALKSLRGDGPELYSAKGRAASNADARPLGTA